MTLSYIPTVLEQDGHVISNMPYNERNEVPSIWIAEACGKAHKHVLRDIELYEQELRGLDFSPNLDLTVFTREIIQRSVGRPSKSIWLPMGHAIVHMARYQGDKATLARAFCVKAVEYVLEQMKSYNLQLQFKKEKHESKIDVIESCSRIGIDLFGQPIFSKIRSKVAMAELNDIEKARAKLNHSIAVQRGIARSIERLNDTLISKD